MLLWHQAQLKIRFKEVETRDTGWADRLRAFHPIFNGPWIGVQNLSNLLKRCYASI